MDPLLQAGVDLLKAMPATEERACESCGRPSGLFDECDRCFLNRLEDQFSELMGGGVAAEIAAEAPEPGPEPEVVAEPEPEQEPEPEPEPGPPVSIPPPSAAPASQNGVPVAEAPPVVRGIGPPAETGDRGNRRMLLIAGLGIAAVVAAFVISRSVSDDSSTAPAAPPADQFGVTDDPAAAALGTWGGRVDVRYDSGFKDHLNVTLNIERLNEGGPAGFSRSRQTGGTCRGPLTFQGAQGDTLRFGYRELNTRECIPGGKITMTPRGADQMAYKEITKGSVNRGILTRR